MKNIINTLKATHNKYVLYAFLCVSFCITAFFAFGNAHFLSADIFQSNNNTSEISSDTAFYIPKNYETKIGQTGEIVIKTHKKTDSLLGFSFEVEYPSEIMKFEGISTKNGVLDGKNFFVQENTNIEGKITVVGATGGDAVTLDEESNFVFLTFTLNDNITPETKEINMQLHNMKTIGADMSEKEVKTEDGKITILHDFSALKIDDFTVSENGELSLSFNNLLKESITLDDFEFTPNAKTEFSSVHVDKENILFKRLNLVGGEPYTLTFKNPILGTKGETIENETEKLSFYVAKDKSPIFQIINTEILDAEKDIVKLTFSEEVDETSVNLRDFQSRTLHEPKSFTLSNDKKEITLTFHDNIKISDFETPDPLRVYYIEALSGKPLTGYLTDLFVYPENISEKGPEMKSATRLDHKTIQLEFFNTLNDNTVDINDFEIFRFTNVEECKLCPECDDKNIIDENTEIEISADKKFITFSNLSLLSTEEYVVMIKRVTIEDPEKNTTAYDQLKFALNSTTKEYDRDFGIQNITAIDNETLSIEFTKAPKTESIKNIYFSLSNASENIEIYSAEQDTSNPKKVIIKTSVQSPLHRYVLSLNPKFFETDENLYLGGKNTVLYTAAEQPKIFTISNISPYRVVIGSTEELVINAQNIPEDITAYAGTYNLELLEKTDTNLRFKVPQNILKGAYDIDFKWTDGGIAKTMKKTTAFVVEDEKSDEITILSEKSYASPQKIPNDGNTTTNLYVYIDDSRGLADLEKVTADLRIIGGPAVREMGKGEIENGMQIYVLENVTVPETIATATTPYKIPLVAQNKSGIHAEGFVSLWVSRDTTASIPPVITKFTISPTSINPSDTSHPVLINAEIKDEDGGEDITTVALDLSPLQLNTIFLKALNTGQESSKIRFFENENPIVIPESVPDGEYSLTLTAIDAQGEETKKISTITVSRSNVSAPSMTNDDTYITPSHHLVKDSKSTFQIHTKVTDPQGADNITNVSVNLSNLGLPPLSLKGGAIEGRAQWYSSDALILPMDIDVGNTSIEITATDKEGNQARKEIDVTIDRSSDTGRPPQVLSDKNYITPVEAIADGETRFSAYVFVQDVDDDISHVILKLGNTAIFKGAELPKGTSSKDINGIEQCISTRTLLCMQPIMRENKGQWFYISDLVIPKTTKARSDNYSLEVLAIDKNKNSANGTLSLPVRTVDTLLQEGTNEVSVVQAVASNEIQIVFKDPIEPSKIKAELFKISNAQDKNDGLSLYSATISPNGKMVTLKTEDQEGEKDYSLNINAEEIGLTYSSFSDRIFNFTGYKKPDPSKRASKEVFKLVNASTQSPEKITLRFSQPLSASSLFNTENILILKAGSKTELHIKELSLPEKNSLEILTSTQQAGSTYNIYYKNIESIYDEKIEKRKLVQLEAFSAPLGENLGNLHGTADFNNDKKVDFADFTLFAAVYGKTYEEADSGDFDGNGNVDFADFTLFSAQYGEVLSDVNSAQNTMHNSASNPNNYTGTDSSTNSNSGLSGSTGNTQQNNSVVYTATPTPTFSATPPPLATPTPTPSAYTPSATPVPQSSASFTYTPTPSPTPTNTPTSTPSTSPSATPTATPTQTSTPTSTPSISPSATPTPTSTPTPTPSASSSTVDPLAQLLGG